MPRFFIEKILPVDLTNWTIEGEDARHIGSVLRMTIGDELVLCDGQRTDYAARITGFDRAHVMVEIIGRQSSQTESPLDLWLFQGLPKSDKFDEIIQKSVELGVSRITPMSCERSVVRIDARDADRKAERWNKIAQAAAKQCGRGQLPTVDSPVAFKRAMTEAKAADLALFFWESERKQNLRELLEFKALHLQTLIDQGKRPRIAILIGPEGGFSIAEVEQALNAGLEPVSLGRRILRTETAGPAALAMLGYQFNDF